MLSFSEFLEEQERFLKEQEIKVAAGAIAQHNGNMSEIAFNHAVQRYSNAKESGMSHEEAIEHVSTTRPLRPSQVLKSSKGHRFHSMVEKSINAYGDPKKGHAETTRTLHDGHHAAVDVIDHIHKNYGPISGKPFHTGPDASGEHAKKLTGATTTADVLIPYKDKNTGERSTIKINASNSGKGSEAGTHIGASLKYSTKGGAAPSKIRGHGLPGFYKKLQDVHTKIHGEEHHGLRTAMDGLRQATNGSQGVLEKHHDFLHDTFGTNPKTGKAKIYDMNKNPRKAAVFSHDPITGNRKLNPGAHSVLRKIRDGRTYNLDFAPGHTPDITSDKAKKTANEIYNSLHSDRKNLTGPIATGIHDALHNIVQNHDSENPHHVRAVHELSRHISNVSEPRSKNSTVGAKTLLVSIKRGKTKPNGGYEKPKTYIGNPINAHRNYVERSKRQGATAKEMFAVSKQEGANNIKFGDATLAPYVNDAGNGSVGITHSHGFHFA